MNTWVKTILDAPSKTRTNLKNAVLEGFKYYGAKFHKIGTNDNWEASEDLIEHLKGPIVWEAVKLDPNVKKLHDDLKNERGYQFVGIVPWVDYIMVSGNQEKLSALWNHEFGSASLMYKIDGVPGVVIINPDMDLHDSTANKIPGNTKERMMGLGG